MRQAHHPSEALLTFADADRSPLSIRAKALVFVDPRSQALRDQVQDLARASQPILIGGESGTGKELLARHVHRESLRDGLFVTVNCAGLSPKWAQAELFGYTSGAYNGSASGRAGWLGTASGGTLYLDEICDLPLALQRQLLDVLEHRQVLRLGATQATPVDVRLVVATSIDLAQAVAAGKFDQQLYQFLNEGRLQLPALRERPGDILPLAEYFLGLYAQRLGLDIPPISTGARHALEAYYWPGNTRELENVIHFALLVSNSEQIEPHNLNLANLRSE